MTIDFKLQIVIVSSLLLIVSCASPSRFRVIIQNETAHQLECSGHFFNQPSELANKDFDAKFETGKKASLKTKEYIHINRPTIQNYNYFWVGCKNDKGVHWVLNDKFEEYGRYWLDISEGLRIDYFIEPNGEINKKYWD